MRSSQGDRNPGYFLMLSYPALINISCALPPLTLCDLSQGSRLPRIAVSGCIRYNSKRECAV